VEVSVKVEVVVRVPDPARARLLAEPSTDLRPVPHPRFTAQAAADATLPAPAPTILP
jgi:hypothetical protein